MLEEFGYSLGCQCNQSARRLGYAYEMAALLARHRRCRRAWHPHLEATKNSLLKAAASAPTQGDAVIIGAGSLHDIPLLGLLDHFEHITLIDVVFSHATRRLAKRFPGRVSCRHFDVTGIIEPVAQLKRLPGMHSVMSAGLFKCSSKTVWVASVNVLNQLPLLPADWLRRQHAGDEQAIAAFSAAVIHTHLRQLMRYDCPVCLITEVETRRYDRGNQLVALRDFRAALQEFQLTAKYCADWLWEVNPRGELKSGERETSTVEVWLL